MIFEGEDIRGRHWTDDEMEWLHRRLLDQSLETLTRSSSHEEKLSVIHWIFGSDIKRELNEKGQAVAFHYAEEEPLSFVSCCKVSGYNPEKIREGVVYQLRKSGLSNHIPREWR